MKGSKRTARQRMQALMFKAPFMIDCETFDGFVVDYLDGSLPRPLRLRFETHLRFCPECRSFLRDYKSIVAMAAAQSDTDHIPVPSKLVDAVLKSVPQQKGK